MKDERAKLLFLILSVLSIAALAIVSAIHICVVAHKYLDN